MGGNAFYHNHRKHITFPWTHTHTKNSGYWELLPSGKEFSWSKHHHCTLLWVPPAFCFSLGRSCELEWKFSLHMQLCLTLISRFLCYSQHCPETALSYHSPVTWRISPHYIDLNKGTTRRGPSIPHFELASTPGRVFDILFKTGELWAYTSAQLQIH